MSTALEANVTEDSMRIPAAQESERRLGEPCESCERKDRFMAIVSHELRNMLAPIITTLNVWAQTNQADSELLKIATQHARQLSRLIDDLLEASRLASGEIQFRRETIDLRNIVERSIQAVTPSIRDRGQELLVTRCDVPLWVNVDPLRLEQVFLNLLNNAVNHTPLGGCIWLQIRRENSSAVFQIRDSGAGIRPEHLSCIFDFFSQADDVNHQIASGLGIGLAVVKSLVELQAGSIKAYSDGPGCGADFTVRLPLDGQATPGAA